MTFDVTALVALTRVTAVASAPGGAWAAVAAQRLDKKDGAKYVSDLWRVALDGSQPARLLTRGEWSDHSPAFGPDGALYFMSNRPTLDGDDEGHERRQQVFRFHPEGGEPERVTREPLGVASFKVAGSAEQPVIAVLAERLPGVDEGEQRERAAELGKNGPTGIRYRQMPVRYWDRWLSDSIMHALIYRGDQVLDLTPGASRHDYADAALALSADGARLVLGRAVWGAADRMSDSDLDVFDTRTGEHSAWSAGPRADLSAGVIAPDGSVYAAVRMQREEGAHGKHQLVLVSLEDGSWRPLCADADLWLVPKLFSADGQRLIAAAEVRGEQALFAVTLKDGALERITRAGGVYDAQGWAGDQLIGVRSALVEPPSVFTCALGVEQAPALYALPGGEHPAAADEVVVESIEVATTDGKMCQAFVVKPARHEGPLPAVFWVHGGPIAAWQDGWQWRWCPLVCASAGYMLVLPNPRGSTGFGQDWVEGIWGNVWGAQCFEDVMAVVDHVASRPDADGERMALMGGSFGGYMTNWVGTQTGERFRCLISHAGVASFTTFHGTTDLPAYWQHMLGLSPWRERTVMDRYSPLRHMEGWRAPTLVIHGGRDYRVDPGEALGLFEALQAHGVPSELLVFPDENHWIVRPRNIVCWYEAVFEYLARHLGAPDAAAQR